MNTLIRHRSIFAADDYAGEQFLIRAALKGCDSPNPLYFFGNGQELVAALESLLSQGQTADLPCLILLDIKMPVMDGWEAMERIKGNPKLRDIPIVLLTNSSASEDSDRGFYLGAARYITKPSDLKGLAEEMRALRNYWGEPPSTPWRGDFGAVPSAKVSPAPKRPNLFLNTRSDISNGSVMVMDIEGVLDLNTVGLFEDALLGLFSRQQYRIVLNMKKVAYISSAGFGVLISVIKEVRQKNGDIKIANVHRDVLNVFEMLGLPDLFRIFRMEKEAVEAFRS